MAAGRTYTPIATQTLTASQAQITISSIPQTYTDLILVFSGAFVSTDVLVMRFNGDTGSNYSDTIVEGNGSTAVSNRHSNYGYSFLNSINLGTGQINSLSHIMNYANTSTYKSFISRVNSAGAETAATIGMWRSTAAINSLTIIAGSSFAPGSTFTLYGIAAA